MKKSKKILICLMLVILCVTGCGKVKLKNGEEAVVTIKDGEDISVDQLYDEMKDRYALSVLFDMVDRQLLEKIYPEDEAEKKFVDGQVAQYQYYYDSLYSTQISSFDEFIRQVQNVDGEAGFRAMLSLYYKRDLATEDYIKDEVITDEEIQKYYDKNIIGDMRASHILIKVNYDSDATDEEKQKAKDDARKKAEDLIKQLNKAKKSEVSELFAKLAKENSEDSSASNGGDLDWFSQGDMVTEFETATKNLKVDEYTKEPVESTYGYHIILKTGQKDKPALDDVKDKVVTALVDEKKEADENVQYKALIALREKYKVEIQDKDLKKQYKNHVDAYKDK